jgi:hypothetical protein
MSNHLHLLLKEEKDDIALALKRITVSYVYWYNWKYSRRGHLFQDRFKSEPVENDDYLLTVIRYIHQNPINAGICKEIDEYEFSSYNCYLRGDSNFIDTDYIFAMISMEAVINFSKEKHNNECLEFDENPNRLSDADAKEIIQKISGCKNSSEFQTLENTQRDEYIKELRANGLSIRQICRLTGISFAIVRKQ